MNVTFRRPTPADVESLAKLVFDAFASLQDRHNFPRDFPAREMAQGFMAAWSAHPKVWGVVAEAPDGHIVGCNFLSERNVVAGVGPVCVDPSVQGGGIGRKLMQAVLARAREIGSDRVRLVQEPFNTVSLSLYTSLGFDVREPLAVMRGQPAGNTAAAAGGAVRPITEADLPACTELCRRVHGFDRTAELRDAMAHFQPVALERGGRIVAYASAPTFYLLNHAVAETEQDMQALLSGAAAAQTGGQPISLIVPIRNSALFRWCLSNGLRVVKPMTLMSLGEYQEPRGSWVPSVEY